MKPIISLPLFKNLFCLTVFCCSNKQNNRLSKNDYETKDTLTNLNNCTEIRTKTNIFYMVEGKKSYVQNWVYDYTKPDSIQIEVSFINDNIVFGRGEIKGFTTDIYLQITYSKNDDCVNMVNPVKGKKKSLITGLNIDANMFFKDYKNQDISVEDNYQDYVYRVSFPLKTFTNAEITEYDKTLYISQISILTSIYINGNTHCENAYTLPVCIEMKNMD